VVGSGSLLFEEAGGEVARLMWVAAVGAVSGMRRDETRRDDTILAWRRRGFLICLLDVGFFKE
jgi:hypothetical protein